MAGRQNTVPVVAALFVDARGPYPRFRRVDCWGVERDARTYAGPWPVVAHPPCGTWGRYARGRRGQDEGCFAAALAAVRRWGGVLEHPKDSAAWAEFGLFKPHSAGWSVADWQGGWSCRVDQGAYGHEGQKATWLYAHLGGPAPAALSWRRARGLRMVEDLCAQKRRRTPKEFAVLLLSIASQRPTGAWEAAWQTNRSSRRSWCGS